jgi:hypothetical protein
MKDLKDMKDMKDTMEMAREAGFTDGELAFMGDNFRRFADLVRADERARLEASMDKLYGWHTPEEDL